jgi:alkylation response protein AidB-like acyl-CoA dehydrogenase
VRLTTEQVALRDSVRGLVGRTPAGRAPAARELWRRLCTEIGVGGLAIPECYGGRGAGPVEVSVVMEELGRTLTPSPALGSAVLATQALLGSGDDEACGRLLHGQARRP